MDVNHQGKTTSKQITTEVKQFQKKTFIERMGFAGKTLWDLVQLLLIPLVLAGAGFWFSAQQHQTDLQIANDQQQQTMLENYLDRMANLLLSDSIHPRLYESKKGDAVRVLAQSMTVLTLSKMDSERKRSVILFLYQADLIIWHQRKTDPGFDFPLLNLNMAHLEGVNLSETYLDNSYLRGIYMSNANLSNAIIPNADLSRDDLRRSQLNGTHFEGTNFDGALLNEANLSGAYLHGASFRGSDSDLSGANLDGADLSGADLNGANLSGANLNGTDLSRADLTKANVTLEQLKEARSLKGAVMPGGTIHQ